MTADPARPIVYLGPSLPVADARRLLDADYRPPVRRGDLPHHHAGPVVVIDGDFHQDLPVSPNELLRLLDGGTPVLGAASMGALRAAELDRYGMRGCGWVYDAYRSGRVVADDEVAVAYVRGEDRPLTVPLVNVRFWLEELVGAGVADPALAARLLRRARSVFYADRSERLLLRLWEQAVGRQTVQALLAASGGAITDVKAADARLVLAAARSAARQGGESRWTLDDGTATPRSAPAWPRSSAGR